MVGVVVRGGTSEPLAPLGVPADIALAPFAARYRVWDFAHATLRNSGLEVLGEQRESGTAAPPAAKPRPRGRGMRGAVRPGARLLSALRAAARVAREDPGATVVVLVADHILDADLRPVLGRHHDSEADLGLLCIPAAGAPPGACPLAVDASGAASLVPDGSAGASTLAWTGDVVVRAGLVSHLLDTLADRRPLDDVTLVANLARHRRVIAHDLEGAAAGGRRPYWHEPSTVEAYYAAHMELCTDSPPLDLLDLYDPGWPVIGTSDGLPPAKVVSGEASHAGQALDALLGEGAVIRGGSVIRSVVGRGVLVEVGAEIEDSLLLDGCRVGRCARVRRAVVGAGAVIRDGEEIGYDGPAGRPGVRRLVSGLTLVPPGAPAPHDACGAR
jgi:glucose-1-phosphate adenylyltransferase